MSNLLFLSAKQVADRWAAVGITGSGDKPISVKTFACWRSNGEGPQQAVVRVMGKVRYSIEALRKYEKEQFGQTCDGPVDARMSEMSTEELLTARNQKTAQNLENKAA
ncbi:hypothetical protein ABIE64_003530 [Thalassospira sp. MBR-102]|jgi:hypothetical protein|uniref:hypothetical protein n=1 Tax=Thalassospira sp. MBR-102 TaxID=3156466 RepID=UPI001A56551B|nr:hypothetical protein [Thalassospira sp.]